MITTINDKKFQSEFIPGKGLCWIPVTESLKVGDILRTTRYHGVNTRYLVCSARDGVGMMYFLVVIQYDGGLTKLGEVVQNKVFTSLEELTQHVNSYQFGMKKV